MNWNSVILVALKILAVFALVLLNGFFVAAEFALVRVRETQLDALVARGQRRARLARHIVRNLNSYLSATQLGVTMASLGLGWMGEPFFAALLSPALDLLGVKSPALLSSISFIVGFSVLTFSEHCGRRTGPQMADHAKDAAGRAVVSAPVTLVLSRILSLQPVAEFFRALAGAPNGD